MNLEVICFVFCRGKGGKVINKIEKIQKYFYQFWVRKIIFKQDKE